MSGGLLHQLIVLPVLLPLLAAALMLLVGERRRSTKNAISFVTIVAVLATNLVLVGEVLAAAQADQPVTRAYLGATGHRRSESSWWSTACRC